MKRSFWTTLLERLGGGSETVTPSPSERLRLSGKAIRIPLETSSFEVEMGLQRLQIHPDLALDPGHRKNPLDFLLFDPERYLPGPGHFLRLAPGTSVTISHGAEDQRPLFSHPREAYRRGLQVRHEGDALVFKDPISEIGTYVSVLDLEDEAGPLVSRRRRALDRVLEIYGGALEPLSAKTALASR